ncbi:hypothetical protein Tco_0838813 [Tanacetum coccineum]|uniref:Uncharacterized protein n=1 Tax=Tanacetum coccineum TaxID=301880 RepID=A0ABQ5ASS8_9ASTR
MFLFKWSSSFSISPNLGSIVSTCYDRLLWAIVGLGVSLAAAARTLSNLHTQVCNNGLGSLCMGVVDDRTADAISLIHKPRCALGLGGRLTLRNVYWLLDPLAPWDHGNYYGGRTWCLLLVAVWKLLGVDNWSNTCIPLVNAGELPEMDPYEEVAQQRQVPPLLPAYVPDPIFVLEPEHLEYHAPSDDDIQVEDQPYADDASPTAESPGYIADSDSMEEDTDEDFIDYPYEPEDGEEDDDEDPEKDPKEDHSEEHEPEDDDDNDDTDDKDEEPIENEEEEEHIALADSSIVPVVDPIPSVGIQ